MVVLVMTEDSLDKIIEKYGLKIKEWNRLMWPELIRQVNWWNKMYTRHNWQDKIDNTINQLLDSSMLMPLSDLLDTWIYTDKILSTDDEKRLLGLSRDLVELEFQERGSSEVIKKRARQGMEERLAEKIKNSLFCYDSESFFHSLTKYYSNFNTERKNEMLGYLENVKNDRLLLAFLNQFLQNPSDTPVDLGLGLLTKLKVLDRFAKEDLSEVDKLKHGLAMKIKDKKYIHDRLRAALIYNSDDVLVALDCASIETAGEEVKRRIGSGASGTTYEVYSTSLDKNLALKIIKRQFFNPKEARILAKLDHPNIVRIYYAGDKFIKQNDEYVPAILMEHVRGPSLKEYIKKYPDGFNRVHAVNYSCQLLDAIDHLREKGAFHRDFNPSNIKIVPRTLGATLKVYDFGFAEDCLDAEPHGNRRYGGESDIFSWGLITYELATGKHLISDRESEESSNSFAEKIQKLKGAVRDDAGNLAEGYKKKIQETVLEELQEPILLALENTIDIESNARFTKIKEIYLNLQAV